MRVIIMKKILVIQNSSEGLGIFADEFTKGGVMWETVHAYKGDPIPSDEALIGLSYHGLMVLGGPMSATDEEPFPFLREEVRLLRAGLVHKLPMLNICLGAQLLARACNVPLTIGGEKEIGWHPVSLIDWYARRNPLFFQAPREFVAFHWHRDTFDIPTDGYRLARSELYPNQAFCINGNAYGIQFHLEVTREMIETWTAEEQGRPGGVLSPAEAKKILIEAGAYLPALHALAHQVSYGFLTTLREPGYRKRLFLGHS